MSNKHVLIQGALCSVVLATCGFVHASEQERLDGALLKAIHHGQADQAAWLIVKKADVNAQERVFGSTPLTFASKRGNRAMVNILIRARADIAMRNAITEKTALDEAIWEAHSDVVRTLLAAGADCVSENRWGGTPLILAACSNNVHSLYDSFVVMQSLLDAKANINYQNEWGKTALHRAAFNDRVDSVRMLLALRADHSLCDKEGYTPSLRMLDRHVLHDNEASQKIMWLLLDAKVDVNYRTSEGVTALSLALIHNHDAVAEFLLLHGGDASQLEQSHKDKAVAIYNNTVERMRAARTQLYTHASLPTCAIDIIMHYYSRPLPPGQLR